MKNRPFNGPTFDVLRNFKWGLLWNDEGCVRQTNEYNPSKSCKTALHMHSICSLFLLCHLKYEAKVNDHQIFAYTNRMFVWLWDILHAYTILKVHSI